MSEWRLHLRVNMVLRITRPGGIVTSERVLHVDEARSSLVLIDIHQKTARDYGCPIEEIATALDDGTAVEIADPYLYLRLPDSEYSDARLLDRDRRVQAIAPFIKALPRKQFTSVDRRELMREICDPTRPNHVSKSVAYSLVRTYFQRGQMDNAVLSDRDNCGFTRKRRAMSPPLRKEGRSFIGDSEAERRAGISISEQMRLRLLPTINSERKKTGNNGKPKTWPEVAQAVWEIHFPSHIELINGRPVTIPKPSGQTPQISQIKRIYYSQQDIRAELLGREGEKQFNLRNREKLGDQRDLAYGPMMTVQIDFTIADIYLVDKRKRIIGRPTIAMIRDTFSRLIIGFAVAWRRESWHTATLAILNMVEDKVEFCKEVGIDITVNMWPSAMFERALVS